MAETIALKDYYNKLVQVQTSFKIARALHTEIYHHLNNGAAVLHGVMRSKNRDSVHEREFLTAARAIADDVARQSNDVMDPAQHDAVFLNVDRTHLSHLIANPQQMTRANFDALSAFNDRLHTIDDRFRDMRINSEVLLLKTSGLVPEEFDLAREPAAFRDYYNKLVQVQLSVKVARSLQEEMLFLFGALKESTELMEPVVEGTLRLGTTAKRLIDLVMMPVNITPQAYDSLAAFNDRLNTINDRFRALRAECEVKNMRDKGLVPAGFKL